MTVRPSIANHSLRHSKRAIAVEKRANVPFLRQVHVVSDKRAVCGFATAQACFIGIERAILLRRLQIRVECHIASESFCSDMPLSVPIRLPARRKKMPGPRMARDRAGARNSKEAPAPNGARGPGTSPPRKPRTVACEGQPRRRRIDTASGKDVQGSTGRRAAMMARSAALRAYRARATTG